MRALLRSENIAQKRSGYIANPLRRLFTARVGQTITVKYNVAGAPAGVSLYGATHSFGVHKPTFEVVAVTYYIGAGSIALVANEVSQDAAIPLVYRPDQGFAPIHEVTEGRNKRIKVFYWRLWFDQNQVLPEGVDLHDELVGPEMTITAAAVERFCDVVGNQGEKFKTSRNPDVEAPWTLRLSRTGRYVRACAIYALLRILMLFLIVHYASYFPEFVDGDLLKLVHLSNDFKVLNPTRPFRVGDMCRSTTKILAVTDNESGKTTTVTGHALCHGEPVIEVRSSFLYRGRFSDYKNTFYIVASEKLAAYKASEACASRPRKDRRPSMSRGWTGEFPFSLLAHHTNPPSFDTPWICSSPSDAYTHQQPNAQRPPLSHPHHQVSLPTT